MITITEAAASQIKESAKQGKIEGLALRVACAKQADGSLHYGMGFDEKTEEDQIFISNDIELIIAPVSLTLLTGTVLDFVELEEGKPDFIFQNPNDPDHQPAQ
ncbi:MAG: iron-sulfur cluster assembly accessory protein [Gammaproteobacteria bacterium]|nr:iron-sulfur cluster assembly accessory protein [Gammaproteobacteria bacterium]